MHSFNYIQTDINLIGNSYYRHFLKIQTAYGFKQRGGAQPTFTNKEYITRLVSDVNILSSQETQQFAFSKSIFNN